MKKKILRRKPHSLRGLYRWLKQYYLPVLHRRIELLPDEVSFLANRMEKQGGSFVVL